MQSDSSGEAYFRLNEDETALSYVIYADAYQIYSVDMNAGSEEENGPIIYTLYNKAVKGITSDTIDVHDEVSTIGDVKAECLIGPLKGGTIKDLIDLITDGRVYIEIHTLLYSSLAELRGTILPQESQALPNQVIAPN